MMKKKLLGLMLVLLCMGSGTAAQNLERALLIDSIVDLSVPKERWQLMDLTSNLIRLFKGTAVEDVARANGFEEIDPLIVEYTLSLFLEKTARTICENDLNEFSNQELRSVVQFMESDAYERLKSTHFAVGHMDYRGSLSGLLGISPSLTDDLYYKDAFDRLYDDFDPPVLEDVKVFEAALDEFMQGPHVIPYLKNSGEESYVSISKSAYNRYKCLLLDFLSPKQVDEVNAFYRTDIGSKVGENGLSDMFLHTAMMTEDVVKNLMKVSLLIMSDSDTRIKIIQSFSQKTTGDDWISTYVQKNRSDGIKLYEMYRPVREVKIGKDTYIGETRRGLPHGKGRLVKSKKEYYDGEFKYGKRYGIVTHHTMNGDSITRAWFGDRYSNNSIVPSAKDGKGKNLLTERLNGYGYLDADTIYVEGLWIDGDLRHGVLKREFKSFGWREECSGRFEGLRLIEGEWNVISDKSYSFSGKCLWTGPFWGINSDKICIGSFVEKSQNEETYSTGTLFVNDELWQLDGTGERTYINRRDTVKESGTFAYSKLYGTGTLKKTMRDSIETEIRVIYNGNFVASMMDGTGCCEISVKKSPQSNSSEIVRYDFFGLPFATINNEFSIILKGRFVKNKFESGYVRVSNAICSLDTDENSMKEIESSSTCKGEYQNGVFTVK